MPEGHTLHALAQRVDRAFAGTTVAASSPQGRFVDGAARLDGLELVEAEAWGKHLFVTFTEEVRLHVHLGLFGRFSVRQHRRKVAPGQAPDGLPVKGEVRLRLLNDTFVGDLRGPTRCALATPGEIDALLARLGPDPLRPDADPTLAWDRISRSRRAVGELLMDQRVIAGIGNVYRSELLHRLALDPATPGCVLPRPYLDALWEDLVTLMPLGVATGRIVTRDSDVRRVLATLERTGTAPRIRPSYAVYRRTGLPCPRCGDTVRSRVAQGRNLFWCAGCQVAPIP